MKRLYLSRLAMGALFFTPFIVLYARSVGIGLGMVLLAESAFTLMVLLLDLPCGHLADRFGARNALAAGTLLQALACWILYRWAAAWAYWCVQPLFALAAALEQGADAALNYRMLNAAGQASAFERSESFTASSLLAVEAASALVGGLLAERGYRYAFLGTAFGQFAAVALLLTIKADLGSGRREDIGVADRLGDIARAIRERRSTRLSLLGMVLAGTAFSTCLYLAPAMCQEAGVDGFNLGLLFSASSVLAALLGASMSRLREPAFLGMALGAVGLLGLFSREYGFLLASIAFIKASRSLGYPFFKSLALRIFKKYGESSALSVATTSTSLGFALLGPLYGAMGDRLGTHSLVLACLAAFFLGAALLASRGTPHARI
jgi:MFS family permease